MTLPEDAPPSTRLPRLAWIGLGNMGRPMVSNIVQKSPKAFEPPLTLYNRTSSRAEELHRALPKGQTDVAYSIPDAVKNADIIFMILFDGDSVKQSVSYALETSGGIKGKLFVDCTTIDAQTASEVADLIVNAGGDFVAMPVFGMVPVAEAGQLICVPAGPKRSIERLRPFIESIGKTTIDLSDQPQSQASMLKVLGNSLMGSMVEALSETHVVAEKCGVGAMNLHRFVESFAPGAFTMMSGRMVSGDYYKRREPITDLALGLKDGGYALDLASESNARIKNFETGYAHLRKLEQYVKENGIKGDVMQIYGIARMDAGLPFENGDTSAP